MTSAWPDGAHGIRFSSGPWQSLLGATSKVRVALCCEMWEYVRVVNAFCSNRDYPQWYYWCSSWNHWIRFWTARGCAKKVSPYIQKYLRAIHQCFRSAFLQNHLENPDVEDQSVPSSFIVKPTWSLRCWVVSCLNLHTSTTFRSISRISWKSHPHKRAFFCSSVTTGTNSSALHSRL